MIFEIIAAYYLMLGVSITGLLVMWDGKLSTTGRGGLLLAILRIVGCITGWPIVLLIRGLRAEA